MKSKTIDKNMQMCVEITWVAKVCSKRVEYLHASLDMPTLRKKLNTLIDLIKFLKYIF